MTTAVIAGGGIAGLALALALGTRGHRVRVLERSEPPPDGPAVKSAELWHRPLVPQAGHDHVLNSLGVRLLRRHAPAVLDAALEEGARLFDLTAVAPPGPGATGTARRPGDDDLVTLAVRRSVLEVVLYRAVQELPTVTVRHGTRATGLLTAAGSVRHRATGVVTEDGERVTADLVVDASGRRSASRSWLTAAGVPVADDVASPTGLRAFCRFYRLRDPDGPPPGPLNRGNAAGGLWGHYAAVLHPADNDVFAVGLATLSDDRALTALREPGAFTAASRLSPYLERWVDEDVARPFGPLHVMALPPNILRGTATDRQSPVSGLLQVGDAACVTDPMLGRGMSLALAHAFGLADLIEEHGPGLRAAADERLAEAAAALAETMLRPWYEQAAHDSWLRADRWRTEVGPPADLTMDRSPPPVPAPPVPPDLWAATARAAAGDPTVWRAFTRVQMSLSTPAEAFGDADFRARVRAAADAPGPPPVPSALSAPPAPRPPTHAELRHAVRHSVAAAVQEGG
ncbi:FAD-dependent oxidoreductase [Streptomyces sp. NPDC054940]